MGSPEVLLGSNGALKDLPGADYDAQGAFAASDASDMAAGKAAHASDAAAAQDSHRRSGRTRTVRVRDGFFDSSLLHYVSIDDTPEEAVPSRRSPKPSAKPSSNPPKSQSGEEESEEEDEEDWDGMMVGPEHQATHIPAFRPLPAQPSASEARFLHLQPLFTPVDEEETDEKGKVTKTRAARAGVTVPMPPLGVAASSADFRYKWRWCKDSAAKRALLSSAVVALDNQLGADRAKKLGLEGLGYKLRDSWQPQEELLFALGMCDKYRMFKYIRQCYLWHRSVHELNAYYHNVWKTRSTDLADEFLSLREADATRADYRAFVERLLDNISTMWDRKNMGDMPKVVKDMTATVAAERAAGPARSRQQRSSSRPPGQLDIYGLSSSDYEEQEDMGAGSDSDAGLSDDSGRRAARRRAAQQRKRAAAAMSGRAANRAGGYGGQGMYGSGGQQGRQNWGGLPAPAGVGLNHWLPPQARGPRSAFQRSAIRTHAKLELPEMPKAPLPNPDNKGQVTTWLRQLPDFRHQLKSHLETVDYMTELAIEDCQRFIRELEDQRQSREDYAEQYISVLMQHGRGILSKLEQAEKNGSDAQQQEQQQGEEGQAAKRLKQEHQQQQHGVPGLGAGAFPLAAAASDQQQQSAQQGDVEMTDAPGQPMQKLPAAAVAADSQQQQDQPSASVQQLGAGHDAVRGAAGAPPASRASMGPPAPRPPALQGGPADSHKQQDGEAQPEQEDTAAGADIGSPADLPFPGGPLLGGWGLSQWAAQPTGPAAMPWLKQPGMNSSGAAHKPIPRPYMHRTS